MYLWIYDLLAFVLANTDGKDSTLMTVHDKFVADYVKVEVRRHGRISSVSSTWWVDDHLKISTTYKDRGHPPMKARSVPKPGECIHTPAVLAMAGARLGRLGVCASHANGGLGDWHLYFARGGRI